MNEDLVKRARAQMAKGEEYIKSIGGEVMQQGFMPLLCDRIEELESKYQDAFQMYVDSNEALLDAKAELQEMKMQTLASLGQAQEAYEAQTKLEEKLKLALDKLKAVDKWVEELGVYAPPETSRVPVFKDLPKLIEELSR